MTRTVSKPNVWIISDEHGGFPTAWAIQMRKPLMVSGPLSGDEMRKP